MRTRLALLGALIALLVLGASPPASAHVFGPQVVTIDVAHSATLNTATMITASATNPNNPAFTGATNAFKEAPNARHVGGRGFLGRIYATPTKQEGTPVLSVLSFDINPVGHKVAIGQ